MRRVCWMVTLLMLFVLPAVALAAPATPYAAETVIHTMQLSEGARRAVDAIYAGMTACQPTIALPENTRYEDAMTALLCLSRDYPELFHFAGNSSVSYYVNAPEYAVSVSPEYAMDAATYASCRRQLLNLAQQVVQQTPNDATSCAEALHDWLCQRATYNLQTAWSGTAWGALMEGQARCEGYAKALTLLLRMAGIPCGMVVGTADDGTGQIVSHGWNVAKINGAYTLIDPTWNDRDAQGVITHWYYGLTDQQMAADHFVEAGSVVPRCTATHLNWHARRGLIVTAESVFRAAVQRLVRTGEAINLRWPDAWSFQRFLSEINDRLMAYNDSVSPEDAFYGSYSVLHAQAQGCLLLRRQ